MVLESSIESLLSPKGVQVCCSVDDPWSRSVDGLCLLLVGVLLNSLPSRRAARKRTVSHTIFLPIYPRIASP